ncbi:MAG: UDP-N-acetylmuramoyl-L-alanyl-D-glutamate--2,6-diaminopimelate ligase [Alphaproteobacteria bacterium]|nr:UDP-N-acetylmuramoyl-L-alanyl-D-glutamate--2,6-diaminopimelate ligase [Alphaproteobacteria bacterium]MCL2504850.1 UDP-N-acetylmuramoyl-L-alanyl-D-glutamate--2,6-diaminopimelate ligase [Alphaproteobacteria bacterium]
MLLSELTNLRIIGSSSVEIKGLSEDSRNIEPGSLFIAAPIAFETITTGITQYWRIKHAIENGAAAVLVPEDTDASCLDGIKDNNIALMKAKDVKEETIRLAAAFYPKQPETIVAVTGTNGKTSTVHFVKELYSLLGYKSASIGTSGVISDDFTEYNNFTTPEAVIMHRVLTTLKTNGVTHVAIEASSQGLDLKRMEAVNCIAGAFTNFTRDHLDYHETMEEYFDAKLGLFNRLIPQGGYAVLNSDIPEYQKLYSTAKERGLNIISFGKKSDTLRLISIQRDVHDTASGKYGQIIKAEIFGKELEVFLPVLGDFQVFNALCAVGLVIGGEQPKDIALFAQKVFGLLPEVSEVKGRMEFIGRSKKGGLVFVDFAHSPDALMNVLSTMKESRGNTGRIGIVFGCSGNKGYSDKGNRPDMGEIAADLADFTIITDDNPGFEEPDKIRKEILSGCKSGAVVEEIGDRAEAIRAGIEKLEDEDVLIIAGKGSETEQVIKGTAYYFDDAEEARDVLLRASLTMPKKQERSFEYN